jgi:hypothetical protein
VRGTHHYAFNHGLPADKGFLTAFEDGKQLQRHKKTEELAPVSHCSD